MLNTTLVEQEFDIPQSFLNYLPRGRPPT